MCCSSLTLICRFPVVLPFWWTNSQQPHLSQRVSYLMETGSTGPLRSQWKHQLPCFPGLVPSCVQFCSSAICTLNFPKGILFSFLHFTHFQHPISADEHSILTLLVFRLYFQYVNVLWFFLCICMLIEMCYGLTQNTKYN